MPNPYDLSPQSQSGDGYGYGASSFIAGGGFGYGGYSSMWGSTYVDVTKQIVRGNQKQSQISASPGTSYSPGTGLVVSSQWEEILGVSAYVTYRRMMLDPQVKASFAYFKYSVLGDGPILTPAIAPEPGETYTAAELADFDKAKEIADFCRDLMAGIDRPICEILGQMIDAAAYRGMLAEDIQKIVDSGPHKGKTVCKSLLPRPQPSWAYVVDAVSGVPVAIAGWTSTGTQVFDLDRFFLLAWEPQPGDPRGTSILTPAFSGWNEKVSLIPERFRHLILFGSPSVVYELPPDTQDQYQLDAHGQPDYTKPSISATQQGMLALSAFRSGGQMVHSAGGKVAILNAANDGGAFTAAKIDCNREITTGILLAPGAIMEAEHDSNANAETKQDATGILIRRGQSWLASAWRGFLRRYVAINEGDDAANRLTPIVAFGVEHHDQEATIKAYVEAGWQAAESQFPAIDAKVGLKPREANEKDDEPTDDEPSDDETDPEDDPKDGEGDDPAEFSDRSVAFARKSAAKARKAPTATKGQVATKSRGGVGTGAAHGGTAHGGNPNHGTDGKFASGGKGGIGSHAVAEHKSIPGEKIDKARRRFADEAETHVATMTNGKRLTGYEPSDVDIPKAGGGIHRVEVKSKSFGDKKELSVHANALYLKAHDAKEHPDHTWHTVTIDARHDAEGGAHRESYSGHDLYYKRGVGAYQLKDMHKVKDVSELNSLINTPHGKLPEAAKGSLPQGKALKELKAKADEERAYNNARSKARKDKAKSEGRSVY